MNREPYILKGRSKPFGPSLPCFQFIFKNRISNKMRSRRLRQDCPRGQTLYSRALFKKAFLILCGLLFASCAGMTRQKSLTFAPSSLELVQQLREYFQADLEASEKKLPQLLKHPFDELETSVPVALEESFQGVSSTGFLPGQPITVGGNSYTYALYVPPSYHSEKAYPVVLCLHGAGFSGDAYLDRWQPQLGENYILACPSISGGEFWTKQGEELVLATLATVIRHYHVDLNRVFLTGMSNGGIGTYLIGLNYPDRFAALIPMAGGLDEELFPLLDNAKNVPIYIIHGTKDEVIQVSFARDIADYLKRLGYSIVYREHDRVHPMAGGHFFPRDELPALMDWIEDKRRNPEPKELVIVRDRDHIGRSYWVRIDKISDNVGTFWPSEIDPDSIKRLKEGAFAKLSAKIENNVITVTSQRVEKFTLLLNPTLVDFNKPVKVTNNRETQFSGLIQPEPAVLLRDAHDRLDSHNLVYSEITISVRP
jgi:pimeloyl-ACP methyl ester carboxylesterase